MSDTTQLLVEGLEPRSSATNRLTRFWRKRVTPIDSVATTSGSPHASAKAPRILILSASVGAGHVRAAEAIKAALTQILPHATLAHVDVLQLTNGLFRHAYGKGYFRAVERAPHLVAMMYDLLDKPGGGSGTAAGRARLTFERFNFLRLVQLLTAHPWDLVINTHFLPPALIAHLRRCGRVSFPQATVVTDFDVHGMWVNSPCEQYFVATDEARASVAAQGADPSAIDATGIPIDPLFSEPLDLPQIRRKHRLVPDRPVLLQLAGGFGVGRIAQIFNSIGQVNRPLQIIVVTGKNESARRQLEAMPTPARHRTRVIGYTTEMHELMSLADLVVSKPGGLTTSECLARGCAMAIVDPIPGQEDRNSDFLLENGCAIKANTPAILGHKLDALLSDPDRLSRLRSAAWRHGRPRAAFDVASRCAAMLGIAAR